MKWESFDDLRLPSSPLGSPGIPLLIATPAGENDLIIFIRFVYLHLQSVLMAISFFV